MSDVRRPLAAALSAVYFLANAVFLNAAESRFWDERRAVREGARAAMAALPAAAAPAAVVQNFPAFSAVSDRLAAAVPSSLLRRHAALLKAIPLSRGSIRGIVAGAGAGEASPVVVFLQDVHNNDEAQANLGAMVESLASAGEAKPSLVGLESAFGPLHVEKYRAFPDQEAVRIASDFLLKEHQITGPVRAAYTLKGDVPSFIGVDDPEHYAANIDAYRRAAPSQDEAKYRLSLSARRLDREKRRIFNPALRAFDRTVNDYRAGRIAFGDYVSSLPEAKGGNAGLFLQALRLEKSLDFKRVEAERAELMERLVKALDKPRLDQLLQLSLAYRAGNLDQAGYHRRLRDFCREGGSDLSRYPVLNEYVRYVLLAGRVDAGELLRETREAERAAYAGLARTPAEKALVEESRRQALAAKLLDFSLTPEEWEEYRSSFTPDSGPLSAFESFYKEAEARNVAMTGNLLAAMERRHAASAVFVAGGFHTAGMTKLLSARGVTVVQVVPKLTRVDGPASAYLGVFTREKTPLETLFRGNRLFVGDLSEKAEVTGEGPAVLALTEGALTADAAVVVPSYDGLGRLEDVAAIQGAASAMVVSRDGARARLFLKLAGGAVASFTMVFIESVRARLGALADAISRFLDNLVGGLPVFGELVPAGPGGFFPPLLSTGNGNGNGNGNGKKKASEPVEKAAEALAERAKAILKKHGPNLQEIKDGVMKRLSPAVIAYIKAKESPREVGIQNAALKAIAKAVRDLKAFDRSHSQVLGIEQKTVMGKVEVKAGQTPRNALENDEKGLMVLHSLGSYEILFEGHPDEPVALDKKSARDAILHFYPRMKTIDGNTPPKGTKIKGKKGGKFFDLGLVYVTASLVAGAHAGGERAGAWFESLMGIAGGAASDFLHGLTGGIPEMAALVTLVLGLSLRRSRRAPTSVATEAPPEAPPETDAPDAGLARRVEEGWLRRVSSGIYRLGSRVDERDAEVVGDLPADEALTAARAAQALAMMKASEGVPEEVDNEPTERTDTGAQAAPEAPDTEPTLAVVPAAASALPEEAARRKSPFEWLSGWMILGFLASMAFAGVVVWAVHALGFWGDFTRMLDVPRMGGGLSHPHGWSSVQAPVMAGVMSFGRLFRGFRPQGNGSVSPPALPPPAPPKPSGAGRQDEADLPLEVDFSNLEIADQVDGGLLERGPGGALRWGSSALPGSPPIEAMRKVDFFAALRAAAEENFTEHRYLAPVEEIQVVRRRPAAVRVAVAGKPPVTLIFSFEKKDGRQEPDVFVDLRTGDGTIPILNTSRKDADHWSHAGVAFSLSREGVLNVKAGLDPVVVEGLPAPLNPAEALDVDYKEAGVPGLVSRRPGGPALVVAPKWDAFGPPPRALIINNPGAALRIARARLTELGLDDKSLAYTDEMEGVFTGVFLGSAERPRASRLAVARKDETVVREVADHEHVFLSADDLALDEMAAAVRGRSADGKTVLALIRAPARWAATETASLLPPENATDKELEEFIATMAAAQAKESSEISRLREVLAKLTAEGVTDMTVLVHLPQVNYIPEYGKLEGTLPAGVRTLSLASPRELESDLMVTMGGAYVISPEAAKAAEPGAERAAREFHPWVRPPEEGTLSVENSLLKPFRDLPRWWSALSVFVRRFGPNAGVSLSKGPRYEELLALDAPVLSMQVNGPEGRTRDFLLMPAAGRPGAEVEVTWDAENGVLRVVPEGTSVREGDEASLQAGVSSLLRAKLARGWFSDHAPSDKGEGPAYAGLAKDPRDAFRVARSADAGGTAGFSIMLRELASMEASGKTPGPEVRPMTTALVRVPPSLTLSGELEVRPRPGPDSDVQARAPASAVSESLVLAAGSTSWPEEVLSARKADALRKKAMRSLEKKHGDIMVLDPLSKVGFMGISGWMDDLVAVKGAEEDTAVRFTVDALISFLKDGASNDYPFEGEEFGVTLAYMEPGIWGDTPSFHSVDRAARRVTIFFSDAPGLFREAYNLLILPDVGYPEQRSARLRDRFEELLQGLSAWRLHRAWTSKERSALQVLPQGRGGKPDFDRLRKEGVRSALADALGLPVRELGRGMRSYVRSLELIRRLARPGQRKPSPPLLLTESQSSAVHRGTTAERAAMYAVKTARSAFPFMAELQAFFADLRTRNDGLFNPHAHQEVLAGIRARSVEKVRDVLSALHPAALGLLEARLAAWARRDHFERHRVERPEAAERLRAEFERSAGRFPDLKIERFDVRPFEDPDAANAGGSGVFHMVDFQIEGNVGVVYADARFLEKMTPTMTGYVVRRELLVQDALGTGAGAEEAHAAAENRLSGPLQDTVFALAAQTSRRAVRWAAEGLSLFSQRFFAALEGKGLVEREGDHWRIGDRTFRGLPEVLDAVYQARKPFAPWKEVLPGQGPTLISRRDGPGLALVSVGRVAVAVHVRRDGSASLDAGADHWVLKPGYSAYGTWTVSEEGGPASFNLFASRSDRGAPEGAAVVFTPVADGLDVSVPAEGRPAHVAVVDLERKADPAVPVPAEAPPAGDITQTIQGMPIVVIEGPAEAGIASVPSGPSDAAGEAVPLAAGPGEPSKRGDAGVAVKLILSLFVAGSALASAALPAKASGELAGAAARQAGVAVNTGAVLDLLGWAALAVFFVFLLVKTIPLFRRAAGAVRDFLAGRKGFLRRASMAAALISALAVLPASRPASASPENLDLNHTVPGESGPAGAPDSSSVLEQASRSWWSVLLYRWDGAFMRDLGGRLVAAQGKGDMPPVARGSRADASRAAETALGLKRAAAVEAVRPGAAGTLALVQAVAADMDDVAALAKNLGSMEGRPGRLRLTVPPAMEGRRTQIEAALRSAGLILRLDLHASAAVPAGEAEKTEVKESIFAKDVLDWLAQLRREENLQPGAGPVYIFYPERLKLVNDLSSSMVSSLAAWGAVKMYYDLDGVFPLPYKMLERVNVNRLADMIVRAMA